MLAIAPPNRYAFVSSFQNLRSTSTRTYFSPRSEAKSTPSITDLHINTSSSQNFSTEKKQLAERFVLGGGGKKSQRLTESRQQNSSPTHTLILLKLWFLPTTSTTWLLLLQTTDLQLEMRTSQHQKRYQSRKKVTLLRVCKLAWSSETFCLQEVILPFQIALHFKIKCCRYHTQSSTVRNSHSFILCKGSEEQPLA